MNDRRILRQILLRRMLVALSCRAQVDRGLTLLEVIVSMVILGISLAVMSPPIVLAVGARVQNQRVEQARAIAQQEIDRVQAAMSIGDTSKRPPVATGTSFVNAAAPTSIVATVSAPDQGRWVDVDGDNENDFFVQSFSDDGAAFANGDIAIFQMGVRVYSRLAEDNLGSLQTEPAYTGVSGWGQQVSRPLAVIYSEVSRSDREVSLDRYREFLE